MCEIKITGKKLSLIKLKVDPNKIWLRINLSIKIKKQKINLTSKNKVKNWNLTEIKIK